MRSANPYEELLHAFQAKTRLLRAQKELFDWLVAHDFNSRLCESIVEHIDLKAETVRQELDKAETKAFNRLVKRINKHHACWYRLTYGPRTDETGGAHV